MTFVANDTSGLVPTRQKALDYDNSDPVPQLQNVSSLANAHVPSQQELDLLFGPLYDEFFTADLKAQLQDKNIAISELKKFIEKCKGKFVETKFDKPFVVRQPNAQQIPKPSVLADAHVSSQQELDLLFGPLYDEFFTAGTSNVNKSSSPTKKSNQQDTQHTMNIQPTSEPSTPTYVHAEENNDNQTEEEHLQDDEFTNPFFTSVQEVAESSSHNIGNSNVHTFNQPQVSEYRWTKDHLLEQVHGNPSKPVQTRRQLETDPEMCMFALTVSTAKSKNIKEAMTDSTWIEAMQEELHQFDRLQVWELVDKPFGKTAI
nr:hypothetical protein [Tanacetum cinerariifolium]